MSTSNQVTRAVAPDAGARVERLFRPPAGSRAKLLFGLGLFGSFALGAGFFGAWLAEEEVWGSSALLAVGALSIALSLLLSARRVPDVRVGDLGVIYGDPAEVARVPWCDVRSLRLTAERLELEAGESRRLSIPLAVHGPAAARIVAEASQRIADKVDVSPKAHERLPALRDDDAERVPAARLQVAGRRCAASGKSVTFESDARLCANCAALYHASHVPAICSSCQRSFEPVAARAAS